MRWRKSVMSKRPSMKKSSILVKDNGCKASLKKNKRLSEPEDSSKCPCQRPRAKATPFLWSNGKNREKIFTSLISQANHLCSPMLRPPGRDSNPTGDNSAPFPARLHRVSAGTSWEESPSEHTRTDCALSPKGERPLFREEEHLAVQPRLNYIGPLVWWGLSWVEPHLHPKAVIHHAPGAHHDWGVVLTLWLMNGYVGVVKGPDSHFMRVSLLGPRDTIRVWYSSLTRERKAVLQRDLTDFNSLGLRYRGILII